MSRPTPKARRSTDREAVSMDSALARQVSPAERGGTLTGRRNPGALRRVGSVARNTFREAVRDRVLYNLVLFVLVLTGGAVFLGELSAAQEAKIIVDMGLSA